VKSDGVLALALVGARARGFHHDLASKLQGLMMTIDELGERGGDVRTQRAVLAAIDALRDIQAQLVAYRSLARGADPHDVALRDLIEAGARCANVALAGALPDAVVATHAVRSMSTSRSTMIRSSSRCAAAVATCSPSRATRRSR
jgi:hypothetical protein